MLPRAESINKTPHFDFWFGLFWRAARLLLANKNAFISSMIGPVWRPVLTKTKGELPLQKS
jgi:hypothetical protein